MLPLNIFGETDSVKGKGLFCHYTIFSQMMHRIGKDCGAVGLYFETEDNLRVMSISLKDNVSLYSMHLKDEKGYKICATSEFHEFSFRNENHKYDVTDYEIFINLNLSNSTRKFTLNRETLSLKFNPHYEFKCEVKNSKKELIKSGKDMFDNFIIPREIKIKKLFKEEKRKEEERKKKRKI